MRFYLFLLLSVLSISSYGQGVPLVPNGYAKYTELGNELYVAALYLETQSSNPSSIRRAEQKRIEMKVIASKYSYRRFKRTLVESTAINNSPTALIENAKAMESFLSWFRGNLTYGDHVVLNKIPTGFTLNINGVELATIESSGLFDMLLNTWIGDVPPNRGFKAQILGQETDPQFEQDFLGLNFSADRAEVVQGWKDAVELAAREAEEEAQRQIELAEAARRRAARPQPTPTPEPTPEPVVVQAPTVDTSQDTVAIAEPQPTPTPEPPESDDEFSAENLLAVQLYANKLLIHSQKNMVYPKISRRLGHQGTVVASVTIDREGKLVEYILSEESKHKPLNSAVKKGIKRSAPYPEMPEKIGGNVFTFRVPVTFKFSE